MPGGPYQWKRGDRVKPLGSVESPHPGAVGTIWGRGSGYYWVKFEGDERAYPFERRNLRWITRMEYLGKGRWKNEKSGLVITMI